MEPLKPSHEMFCQEVIKEGGNKTSAYLKVYPKSKYHSARHSASLLLTNVYIKQRIYELLEQNGLGLHEVIKKLSEFMNEKRYRVNTENGERILIGDNKDLQLKGLTWLYGSMRCQSSQRQSFAPRPKKQISLSG